MLKYRVIVERQNLLTHVDGVRQRLGFYTNVFIEAFTPDDPASRAIELVREDVDWQQILINAEDDPINLSADEIQEIESFDGILLPRTGLVFYPVEKGGETT